MNKTFIASGIAVVAVFAGVVWFARDAAEPPAPPALDRTAEPAEAPAPPAAALAAQTTRGEASKRPVPTDPRLAALMVTPGNDLIEYIAGPDGRVIQEIDNDPSSQGYRKPMREYLYAADKIAGLTAYRYLGDQVQVIRAMVTYKPDGSVDEYRESTEYRKP